MYHSRYSLQDGPLGAANFTKKRAVMPANKNYTEMREVNCNRGIPNGPFLQQNFVQEWNSGRQIVVTDIVIIIQSRSEASMEGKIGCIQF